MNLSKKKIGLLTLLFVLLVAGTLYASIVASATDTRTENIYCLINQKVVIAEYDGEKENATVKDPDGLRVSIAYNNGEARFFPQKEGLYKISYSDGYVTQVHVYAQAPENSFTLAQNLSGEYGVGKELRLPLATITSAAASYSNYEIRVEQSGSVLKTFSIKSGDAAPVYKLTQKGDYTIRYCITDVFGTEDSQAFEFACTGKSEMNYQEIPAVLDFGAEYDFGQPVAVKDGKSQNADITVTFGGEEVEMDGTKFVPTKYGTYEGVFSAVIDGETIEHNFQFQVLITPASLFTASDSIVSITPNVPYPLYAYDRNHTGVEIIAASSGASVELKNPVNLSNIDNGQDIISFQAISKEGYQNIKQIQISLIDENDETNYIRVNFTAHITSVYDAYAKAMIKGVGATGIGSPDYGNEGFVYSDVYGDQSGAMMSHGSFLGSRISTDPSVNDKALDFNFRYYADTQQLWMTARDMSRYEGSQDTSIVSHMILDLDDESQVGAGKAFKGFSSEKVKIRITFTQLEGTGGIILRTLGGYNFEGVEFIDNEAPEIIYAAAQDEANFGGQEAPYAVVNKEYKLPQLIAEDFVDGRNLIEPEVYFLSENGERIPQQVQNYAFIPGQAGEYEIVFRAIDANNNSNVKTFKLEAYNSALMPVYANEPSEEDRTLNSVFEIPQIQISNVSGVPQTERKLTYAGKEIIIDEDIPNIYLSELGLLVYEQKWTDYLGNVYTKKYEITVSVSGVYVEAAEDIKVMEVGQTVTIPDFIALDGAYAPGEPGYELAKKIVVTDSAGDHVLGEDRSYTAPSTAQEITIKYYAGTNGEPAVEKKVNVIQISDGGDEIVKYFRTENVQVQATAENVTFTTQQADNLIEMPYPVVAENMNLQFSFPATGSTAYIDIRFTDIKNENLSLFLRFKKPENGQSSVMVNGSGESYFVSCNNDRFSLVFDAKNKCLYDSDGLLIAELKSYENGTQFLGFTDGIAFINFQMGQVSGNSVFCLEALSNQIFNNTVANIYNNNGGNGPAIRYENTMESKRVSINTKILISAAKGYDVLSSYPTAVTITVTLSTGTSTRTIYKDVSAEESRELVLDEYGYYTITYKAINKFMPAFSQYVTINVIDEQAPQLSVNGSIDEEYALNSTITIPSMSVQDNRPDYGNHITTKYIFVVKHMRREPLQEGQTYTFTESGTYQILYIAYDAAYNKTVQVFNITVK